MTKKIRVLAWVVGSVVAVAAALFAVGAALPDEHVAVAHIDIAAPPDAVAARIADPERYEDWQDGDTTVIARNGDTLDYRQTFGTDVVNYRFTASPDGRNFRSEMLDRNLPYGGVWSINVAPNGAGTRVTITENGYVHGPVFKLMSKFVFGHTEAMEGYLGELKASFETTPPR